jgi:hypothetical protein
VIRESDSEPRRMEQLCTYAVKYIAIVNKRNLCGRTISDGQIYFDPRIRLAEKKTMGGGIR